MRKERLPESDRKRSECPVRDEEARIQNAAAEQNALDAAVRRSINLHGPWSWERYHE